MVMAVALADMAMTTTRRSPTTDSEWLCRLLSNACGLGALHAGRHFSADSALLHDRRRGGSQILTDALDRLPDGIECRYNISGKPLSDPISSVILSVACLA